MGLRNYLRSEARTETPSPAVNTPVRGSRAQSALSEKPPSTDMGDMELHPPSPRNFSRPQSLSAQSIRSARSGRSSMYLDEIKHEVMVNYLYQQQCAHLWVSDGSGEIEGVVLRKSRGHYMACPPQLISSPFALAASALNVQVSQMNPPLLLRLRCSCSF